MSEGVFEGVWGVNSLARDTYAHPGQGIPSSVWGVCRESICSEGRWRDRGVVVVWLVRVGEGCVMVGGWGRDVSFGWLGELRKLGWSHRK